MTDFLTQGADTYIKKIVAQCGEEHPAWAETFALTYADTLKHALIADGPDRIFVLTGDIPAMWQRDSTAQMRPYLVPARTDAALADVIERVINRQFFNMALDPYANAFNQTPNNAGHQTDETQMGPWIWERKYELDSLCYPVQLAYLFWQNTGRTSHFNAGFEVAIEKLLQVIVAEQDHRHSPYRFARTEDRPEDTLIDKVGRPVAPTGMSWNGFRPSDDACVYGYLIPSNLFAVEILRDLAEIYREVLHRPAERFEYLANTIEAGVARYGLTTNAAGEKIYAFEVDGLGNQLVMDDANVPNLLSLPYLGAVAVDDPIYRATRKTILSSENPYYYAGTFGEGLGSPHTPNGYIWPIAKAIEGLTEQDRSVKAARLDGLVATTAGTRMMHEGYNVENPTQYTREWFSWANMMFCELVMDYFGDRVDTIR
ncbi:glycoside hydrolase family 125 protein [Lacticaseibacillus absianus]|uniref:glycoside hydrolase family 125 protein n=1 Tax=Lacticaseibacillus absianus TaxID=2729623 RepID=UPI0015C6DC7E|nr:glycoside hydrolase family 125 protein [Lacticaseibacillus absianus]